MPREWANENKMGRIPYWEDAPRFFAGCRPILDIASLRLRFKKCWGLALNPNLPSVNGHGLSTDGIFAIINREKFWDAAARADQFLCARVSDSAGAVNWAISVETVSWKAAICSGLRWRDAGSGVVRGSIWWPFFQNR